MRFQDSFKFYMTLTGFTEEQVWEKLRGNKLPCESKNEEQNHRLIQKWIDRIL